MYRMRPATHLLDKFHELERQEVFFSDLKSLNDPMEGFMKFFWKGDKIVWENFFKHYLLCLEQVLVIASLVEDGKTISIDDIPVFKTIEDFPTARYREAFGSICMSFLDKDTVKRYLEFLCRRGTPINSEELVCHLKNLHLLALDSILQIHRDLGFSKTDIPKEFSSVNFNDMMEIWENNREEIEKDPALVNALYDAQLHVHQQMALILAFNQHKESRSQIKRFLLFEFTEAFVTRVRELAYPHAYVACFLADCSDPSLWGYYADGHKGVCLKFRNSMGSDVNRLSLNTIVGWGSGPIRGIKSFRSRRFATQRAFRQLISFDHWVASHSPNSTNTGTQTVLESRVFALNSLHRRRGDRNGTNAIGSNIPNA